MDYFGKNPTHSGKKRKRRFSIISVMVGFACILLVLLLIGFGYLWGQSSVQPPQLQTFVVTEAIYLPDISTLQSVPFSTVSSNTNLKTPSRTPPSQGQIILNLLNADRVQSGLSSLTLNDQLTAAATTHSLDMAVHDFLSHTGSDESQPSERVTRTGYFWSGTGENVLQRWDTDAETAYQQWWDSPTHHANMMNGFYTEIGIAYARADSGRIYYTMVLGTSTSTR